MARRYKVMTDAVAVSAAQDLMQIKGAAGKMLLIRRVVCECTDTTAPTNQQLQLRGRFLPVTVSDGSGGSTPSPTKTDPGDAAASFTALANNTSKATTSGTAIENGSWGVNIFAGLDEMLDAPITIGPSESYVFELLSTVFGTVHLTTFVEVDEYGG